MVATPEALDLVKYLQSLNRSYPVLPAEPREAAGAPAEAAGEPAPAS